MRKKVLLKDKVDELLDYMKVDENRDKIATVYQFEKTDVLKNLHIKKREKLIESTLEIYDSFFDKVDDRFYSLNFSFIYSNNSIYYYRIVYSNNNYSGTGTGRDLYIMRYNYADYLSSMVYALQRGTDSKRIYCDYNLIKKIEGDLRRTVTYKRGSKKIYETSYLHNKFLNLHRLLNTKRHKRDETLSDSYFNIEFFEDKNGEISIYKTQTLNINSKSKKIEVKDFLNDYISDLITPDGVKKVCDLNKDNDIFENIYYKLGRINEETGLHEEWSPILEWGASIDHQYYLSSYVDRNPEVEERLTRDKNKFFLYYNFDFLWKEGQKVSNEKDMLYFEKELPESLLDRLREQIMLESL